MRRLCPVLLLWGLLCGAAPVPVLTPEHPVLGSPLLATLSLPDDETELAGIPDLGSFELLAPPRRTDEGLQILLLPMRPGLQTLPSFSLHQGRSRQLATPPLEVTVSEGLEDDSAAAPLMNFPFPAEEALPAWPLVFIALGVLSLSALWMLARRRRPLPPGEEDDDPGTRLARLQRLLDGLPGDPAERRALSERLERLRFAPGIPEAVEIEELEGAVESLAKEKA